MVIGDISIDNTVQNEDRTQSQTINCGWLNYLLILCSIVREVHSLEREREKEIWVGLAMQRQLKDMVCVAAAQALPDMSHFILMEMKR